MEKGKYRCMCCDQVKANRDRRWVSWEKGRSMTVAICRSCYAVMTKNNIKYASKIAPKEA